MAKTPIPTNGISYDYSKPQQNGSALQMKGNIGPIKHEKQK